MDTRQSSTSAPCVPLAEIPEGHNSSGCPQARQPPEVTCAAGSAEKKEEKLSECSAEKPCLTPKSHITQGERKQPLFILCFRASDSQPRRTAADEALPEAAEEAGEGTAGAGAERKQTEGGAAAEILCTLFGACLLWRQETDDAHEENAEEEVNTAEGLQQGLACGSPPQTKAEGSPRETGAPLLWRKQGVVRASPPPRLSARCSHGGVGRPGLSASPAAAQLPCLFRRSLTRGDAGTCASPVEMAESVDSRILELREKLEMDLIQLGEEHHDGIRRKKEQHAAEVRAASVNRKYSLGEPLQGQPDFSAKLGAWKRGHRAEKPCKGQCS